VIKFRQLFIDHPASVGESYLEHAAHASRFGISMLYGALACFTHAVVPSLHVSTGSKIVSYLNNRMVLNRRRRSVAGCSANGLQPADFLAESI
jgi:Family of unknown function (DUF6356)